MRCKRCALPSTYPGVHFNEKHICNYCAYFDGFSISHQTTDKNISDAFIEVIEDARRARKNYDGLLCFSGGKDSTYLLYYLTKNLGLRILAYSLDNGFQSPTAARNIRHITETLNVDLIVMKPRMQLLRNIFVHILTQPSSYPKELIAMMSPLCAACQGIIVGTALKMATEKTIPLIFTGYTPSQYPNMSIENFLKTKSCIYFSTKVHKDDPIDMIRIIRDPIEDRFGQEIDEYYFRSQYLTKGMANFPKVIFPFHGLIHYKEKEVYKVVEDLGWKKPTDTDPSSSNCMINEVGNYAAVKQFGFHPYAGDLSFSVRRGELSYKKALSMMTIDEESPAMVQSLRKLRLNKEDIYGEFPHNTPS